MSYQDLMRILWKGRHSFDFQSSMQVSKTNLFFMNGAPDNNNFVKLSDCTYSSSSKSCLL